MKPKSIKNLRGKICASCVYSKPTNCTAYKQKLKTSPYGITNLHNLLVPPATITNSETDHTEEATDVKQKTQTRPFGVTTFNIMYHCKIGISYVYQTVLLHKASQ